MIVTVTVHPSLDRTITLGEPLTVGDVHLASAVREDAGGKGVNVAGVIARAGHPALAVLPLAEDDPLRAALTASGVTAHTVPVGARSRANLALVDPAGVTTKINLPGAVLDERETDAVIAATVAASTGASWLVLAGSLPPDAPDDLYVRIIEAVRAHGDPPRIAVDTSGGALHAVATAGHPDLIKPNEHELAELAGVALDPGGDLVGSVAAIARALVPSRVSAALVTLGAHGAVLIDAEGAWCATPPPVTVRSTVGAGDSSLAGYLLAAVRGAGPIERLRNAVRYGAAAAALAGTQHPDASDLPAGEIPVRAVVL